MANGGDGGVRPCERESEGRRESRGKVRESRGRGVASSRASRRGGEGRQARREVAWRGGARARRPHSPPSVEDEDDRGGRRAGPPAGWAGQLAGPHSGGAQVSSSCYLVFCFLISDICFDLNKILNHLYTLCQFLQELDILFQSSFINGIIFGPYFIYI